MSRQHRGPEDPTLAPIEPLDTGPRHRGPEDPTATIIGLILVGVLVIAAVLALIYVGGDEDTPTPEPHAVPITVTGTATAPALPSDSELVELAGQCTEPGARALSKLGTVVCKDGPGRGDAHWVLAG